MCYTALLIKPEPATAFPHGELAPQIISSVLASERQHNQHGFYLATDTGTRHQTLTETDHARQLATVLAQPWRWLLVHYRLASAGAVTLDNVHGWLNNGYQFTHNGHIMNGAALNGKQSDSLVFFNALAALLPADGNVDGITTAWQTVTTKQTFTGRALLATPQGNVLSFGDFHVYGLGAYLWVSSAAVTCQLTEPIGDLSLSHDWQPPTRKIEGIWQFDDLPRQLATVLPNSWQANYGTTWSTPKKGKQKKYTSVGFYPDEPVYMFELGDRVKLRDTLPVITNGKPQPLGAGTVIRRKRKKDNLLYYVAWDNFTNGYPGKWQTTKVAVQGNCCLWKPEEALHFVA